MLLINFGDSSNKQPNVPSLPVLFTFVLFKLVYILDL